MGSSLRSQQETPTGHARPQWTVGSEPPGGINASGWVGLIERSCAPVCQASLPTSQSKHLTLQELLNRWVSMV